MNEKDVMDKMTAVPNYDGYFASRDGNVYSGRTGKLINIGHSCDKDGYLKVMLIAKNGKHKHLRKHRVIALTFLGASDLMVNHKNGIKTDNRVENLEYVTERENQSHWRLRKGFSIGVCWAKKEQKWRAYFQKDNKWEHLGFYSTKEEAKAAYQKRLKRGHIKNRYDGTTDNRY